VDDLAVPVAEHLHLDVARALDEALHVEAPVPEGALALAAGAGDLFVEVRGVAHDAHALAAAARRRLDEERHAERAGAVEEGVGVVVLDRRGRDRKAARRHEGAGADLVAHERDGVGIGADERDAGLRGGAREIGVLRQEAVARMDRAGAGAAGGVKDLLPVEEGRDGRAALDRDRRVRHRGGRRAGIRRVVHEGASEAEIAERADDPDRDLAAVGDQHRVEG
jgi:hypothetical protein